MRGRLWGLVPLAGVAWAGWDYAAVGTLPQLAWACNVAALAVGLGMLSGGRLALWTGTTVLVAALPLWGLWALSRGDEGSHALLTHLASPALGAMAVRRGPRPPGVVPVAVLSLVVLVALSWAFTPRALDVNFAFQPLPVQGMLLVVAWLALLGVAHGLERLAVRPLQSDPLLAALGLEDEVQARAFFQHLWRSSRRGPGEKRALKQLVDRYNREGSWPNVCLKGGSPPEG